MHDTALEGADVVARRLAEIEAEAEAAADAAAHLGVDADELAATRRELAATQAARDARTPRPDRAALLPETGPAAEAAAEAEGTADLIARLCARLAEVRAEVQA